MDDKKLQALATELAKGIKTEADLNQFSRMLTKLTVETTLNSLTTLGMRKTRPKQVPTPVTGTPQKHCLLMTARLC